MVADARKIKGVTEVRVDQATATLHLRFDPKLTDDRTVALAVQAIVDHLD